MKKFDKFVEAKRKTAPEFTLFGAKRTLPATLRYDAVLELQRLSKRQKDETVTEDEAFRIFELVLGTQLLLTLRAHDEFTMDLATEIIKWALEAYGVSGDSNAPKTELALK